MILASAGALICAAGPTAAIFVPSISTTQLTRAGASGSADHPRAEQSTEAIRTRAALVDHETIRQAEARRQRDAAHARRRTLRTACEHVFGEDGGTRTESRDRHAVCIAPTQQSR